MSDIARTSPAALAAAACTGSAAALITFVQTMLATAVDPAALDILWKHVAFAFITAGALAVVHALLLLLLSMLPGRRTLPTGAIACAVIGLLIASVSLLVVGWPEPVSDKGPGGADRAVF